MDGLDILPCGPCPNNPVELLNNGFFADMLNKLREKYDRIIIDSPPVMPVADARVIAALGDATLLVLRAERSTRRIAIAARNELWRVRATRIGVVVNGVPIAEAGQLRLWLRLRDTANTVTSLTETTMGTNRRPAEMAKSGLCSRPNPSTSWPPATPDPEQT